MYDVEHPAYKELGKIGREITTKVKPRAVVVFSAHWQAGRDTVQVNTAEITELIYDFYGFPSHYYEEKYPNVGSKEVATKVLDLFKQAGIKAEGVKRGLDHGVWASFKCVFEPETNPLNVPVVQVSLFNSEDPMQHYRLGQAVQKLREENILIIVSGMAVHNLRDLRFTFGNSRPMPYTVSFDEALKDAVTTPPTERAQALTDLLKRGDARQAHPTFDHLLPIHVGAGAAGDDAAKRLFTLKEGSMSWAQFRFGEVANASTL
ncbi:aromatic ring-opening dioxygenase LigB subunit [Aspergillus heterothallicus]